MGPIFLFPDVALASWREDSMRIGRNRGKVRELLGEGICSQYAELHAEIWVMWWYLTQKVPLFCQILICLCLSWWHGEASRPSHQHEATLVIHPIAERDTRLLGKAERFVLHDSWSP